MQNRVPGKALGCNFSRYIRDGSRNEKRKEGRRYGGKRMAEKARVRKGEKRSPLANFRPSRTTTIVPRWRLRRITRRGIRRLSKSLCLSAVTPRTSGDEVLRAYFIHEEAKETEVPPSMNDVKSYNVESLSLSVQQDHSIITDVDYATYFYVTFALRKLMKKEYTFIRNYLS